MTITYHIVSAEYFRECLGTGPYTPADFEKEGFIHCTDGEQHVADTANRYFNDDRRMYLALAIDTSLVEAEIRYEDQVASIHTFTVASTMMRSLQCFPCFVMLRGGSCRHESCRYDKSKARLLGVTPQRRWLTLSKMPIVLGLTPCRTSFRFAFLTPLDKLAQGSHNVGNPSPWGLRSCPRGHGLRAPRHECSQIIGLV